MRFLEQTKSASQKAGSLSFDAADLREWIVRVSGIDKTGATDGEKSLNLVHSLGDDAVRLAGLQLTL
jgi:hypothetical protein